MRRSLVNCVLSGQLLAAVALGLVGCTDQAEIDRQWAIDQADLAECVVANVPGQSASLGTLDWAAQAALDAGRLEEARVWAQQLLDGSSGHEGEWSYGNAIHNGHAVLGRVALQSGDLQSAKDHLLAAGTTPGSPQLGSFGPNVVLARDLLAAGEREVVLAYFDQCALFWHGARHKAKLDEWRRAVAAGEMPDFGANLVL